MPQSELVKLVAGVLQDGDIAFMLTGSLVSSLQGEPRLSHDIDLVVQLSETAVPSLLTAFAPPRFYLSESAMRAAIATRRMFNLLDTESGDKADFWLLTDSPFDVSRFQRRIEDDVMGVRCCVSTPEDTILQKLLWAKESGGSQKQFIDALRVYEVQGSSLDQPYLERWAAALGIAESLAQLRQQATL